MTALQLISFIDQLLFAGLFGVVLLRAIRAPSRATINVVLLFGSIAAFLAAIHVADFIGPGRQIAMTASLVFLNAAPLAMLRLVDDFSESPRWVQALGAAAFVVVSLLAVLRPEVGAPIVELAAIAFFLGVGGYAAFNFATASRRARGITSRRMAAVSIGAILFIAAIALLFVGAVVPTSGMVISATALLLALAAGIAFLLGFAPPAWIRRAWREPDLRRFLEESVRLVTLPDDHEAFSTLARSAADALGANGAAVGLADEEGSTLRYASRSGSWLAFRSDELIGGRAFTARRRLVVPNAAEADPAHADIYRETGASIVIAAPVLAEDRRLGVLTVYAKRAPIFVDDDLWLLDLLADQTAVVIEARALTHQVSQLRAREEATRLKEEFLSAAAHDLRTPLTVVLGQAELLARRAARNPEAPTDPAGLARVVREARRLRELVNGLLDVQRLEQGGVLTNVEPADLGEIAEAVVARYADSGSRVRLHRPEVPIVVSMDRGRMEQVIDNLVENAIKYGPARGMPEVIVEADGPTRARVAVVDHGIGIPTDERERVFERFYRASNATGITQTGLGLGLYICRRVVEAHGGTIWYEETAGGGTTFVVALPLTVPAEEEEPSEPMAASPPGRVVAEVVADA